MVNTWFELFLDAPPLEGSKSLGTGEPRAMPQAGMHRPVGAEKEALFHNGGF
jgi:hypothetical protein